MTSRYGAGYQALDLARRLEALVEHHFGEDMVAGTSFRERLHLTSGEFDMLELVVRDVSFSLPNDPILKTRSDGSCP